MWSLSKSEATAVGENEWVYFVYMSLHGRAKEDAKNASKRSTTPTKTPAHTKNCSAVGKKSQE